MSAISVDIPVLETERLILRGHRIEDLEEEKAFQTSDRAKGIGGPHPPERGFAALCGYIGHWVLRGYGMWALEEKATGRYLGRVGCYYPDLWLGREIGWSVTAAGEGRGIAYEAALKAREYAYGVLGWTTAISVVSPDNTRSMSLAQRMGCTRDEDWDHHIHGVLTIWRHPGPETLA
ncbi:MAG: GNAT family N-acetyltransferase [Pseudomonadota bacterium]